VSIVHGEAELVESLDAVRGRDAGYPATPAQTRARAANAHGSYLGCWRRTSQPDKDVEWRPSEVELRDIPEIVPRSNDYAGCAAVAGASRIAVRLSENVAGAAAGSPLTPTGPAPIARSASSIPSRVSFPPPLSATVLCITPLPTSSSPSSNAVSSLLCHDAAENLRAHCIRRRQPARRHPRCCFGHSSTVRNPRRAASTAAATPPGVDPYTSTSQFFASTSASGAAAIASRARPLIVVPFAAPPPPDSSTSHAPCRNPCATGAPAMTQHSWRRHREPPHVPRTPPGHRQAP